MFSRFNFSALVLFLVVTLAHGQDEKKFLDNQFKFSLLKVVDPINPGLEVSYERRYQQFSTQFTAAYLRDLFNTTEYYHNDFNGYRLGVEEKFFFLSQERIVQPYSSIDLVYAHARMKDIQTFAFEDHYVDTWGYQRVERKTYKDTFTVDKTTLSLNCKFGLQVVVKHFVIETSIGVGLKYREARHEDRLQPGDYIDRSGVLIPPAKKFAVQEGSYFTFNIPFAVKIGCAF